MTPAGDMQQPDPPQIAVMITRVNQYTHPVLGPVLGRNWPPGVSSSECGNSGSGGMSLCRGTASPLPTLCLHTVMLLE